MREGHPSQKEQLVPRPHSRCGWTAELNWGRGAGPQGDIWTLFLGPGVTEEY